MMSSSSHANRAMTSVTSLNANQACEERTSVTSLKGNQARQERTSVTSLNGNQARQERTSVTLLNGNHVLQNDEKTELSGTHEGGEKSARSDHKYAPLEKSVIDKDGMTHWKPAGKGYLQLISTAILDSENKRLLLHEIYEAIMKAYPYYQHQSKDCWKNSIRHCLSLNNCFVKQGKCHNGKGNYWAVHPACLPDFRLGNFSRLNARRKSKRGTFSQVDHYMSSSASVMDTAYTGSGFLSESQPLFSHSDGKRSDMQTVFAHNPAFQAAFPCNDVHHPSSIAHTSEHLHSGTDSRSMYLDHQATNNAREAAVQYYAHKSSNLPYQYRSPSGCVGEPDYRGLSPGGVGEPDYRGLSLGGVGEPGHSSLSPGADVVHGCNQSNAGASGWSWSSPGVTDMSSKHDLYANSASSADFYGRWVST